VRHLLLLAILDALACSSRRTPTPVLKSNDADPMLKGGSRDEVGVHLVRLDVPGKDWSCLEVSAGTRVSNALTDEDVRKIEALIRKVDTLPIVAIGRLEWFSPRPNVGTPDFEARTGVACGGLSGRGTLYRISRHNGEWAIAESGNWAS
jgi:hypothetical protein